MDKPRQLTLIADICNIPRSGREMVSGYNFRKIAKSDRSRLAELYYAVYPRSIVKNIKTAYTEIDQTFDGVFGELDLEASPVALYSKEIIASIQTVKQAPWDFTPSGPFIIQVMVHPGHIRLGLAEFLIRMAIEKLSINGLKTAALRVMSDNEGAVALYRKIGFEPWKTKDGFFNRA